MERKGITYSTKMDPIVMVLTPLPPKEKEKKEQYMTVCEMEKAAGYELKCKSFSCGRTGR